MIVFYDLVAELHLSRARQNKMEDITDDDIPSTSGRQFLGTPFPESYPSKVSKVVLPGMLVF